MTDPLTALTPATTRRTPVYFQIAAWSVPLLVLAQFSMVAVLPVAVLAIAPLIDRRVRPLRWWTGLLAATYATPLTIWILREDGAQSLSKDMSPVFVVLITLVSAVVLLKIVRRRRAR
ncbi:hypothetical protein ACFXQA_05565 [Microbacterium sp. P07]|uniref:hypothetical protein n=1 Tax=Microbacterium sp. P07 TaxID=3366952 RepID=UPI003747758A